MDKKTLPSISKILSLTSLIYVLTASAGLIYSVLYYKEFSIDISHYIELEESLLLFMPKIRGIGAFFIFFALIATGIFHLVTKCFRPRTLKLYLILLLSSVVFYFAARAIVFIIYSDDFIRYRSMFFIQVAVGVFLFTLGLYLTLSWMKIQITASTCVVIYILFMYAYGTFALCYLNVKTIKTFKKISCAHIYYNDDTPPVLATSANKYIGRSKKYIFLYDSASKEATILSAEHVQRIVLEK